MGGAFLYLTGAGVWLPVGMEAKSAVGGAFLYLDAARAFSSVGRAPPLQGGGRGIKTLNAHDKAAGQRLFLDLRAVLGLPCRSGQVREECAGKWSRYWRGCASGACEAAGTGERKFAYLVRYRDPAGKGSARASSRGGLMPRASSTPPRSPSATARGSTRPERRSAFAIGWCCGSRRRST